MFADSCVLRWPFHCEHDERGISGVFSSSNKDSSTIGLGSIITTLFNHSYLHKGPISQYIHTGD